MGLQVVGFETQSRLEFRDGLVMFAYVQQGVSQVEVGGEIVRLKAKRVREFIDGLAEISLEDKCDAKVIVTHGFRVGVNRLGDLVRS